MELNNTLELETDYLFNCNFFDDDFDPEGREEHLDKAEEVKKNYTQAQIIHHWLHYLYEKCFTPETIINFCNLFVYYGGTDLYIPEPYKLAGYLYYHTEGIENWDDVSDIIESVVIPPLERQGLIDLMKDPCYRPEQDPHILAEIALFKSVAMDI